MEKDSRLREYYLQYSDDSSNWMDYTFEGQRKVSYCIARTKRGNNNQLKYRPSKVVIYILTEPVSRIYRSYQSVICAVYIVVSLKEYASVNK